MFRLIRADLEWHNGIPAVTNLTTMIAADKPETPLADLEELQPTMPCSGDTECFDIVDAEYYPMAICEESPGTFTTFRCDLPCYAVGCTPPNFEPPMNTRNADRIDGYDRDDLGESPDF